jgi:hypothetical protein
MFSCQRVAELTSRELDEPLSFGQRIALGFHRIVCSACNRFKKQLVEIDRDSKELIADNKVPKSERLSDEAGVRIRRALKEAAKE